MDRQRITLNRWLVGLSAVACLLAAGIVAWSAPHEQFWWGGFLRGSVVLAALWFCLPTRNRPAAWADFSPLSAALFAAAVLLTILKPKIGLLLLLGVLAARAVTNFWTRRR